jgi:hypothetical protein
LPLRIRLLRKLAAAEGSRHNSRHSRHMEQQAEITKYVTLVTGCNHLKHSECSAKLPLRIRLLQKLSAADGSDTAAGTGQLHLSRKGTTAALREVCHWYLCLHMTMHNRGTAAHMQSCT